MNTVMALGLGTILLGPAGGVTAGATSMAVDISPPAAVSVIERVDLIPDLSAGLPLPSLLRASSQARATSQPLPDERPAFEDDVATVEDPFLRGAP